MIVGDDGDGRGSGCGGGGGRGGVDGGESLSLLIFGYYAAESRIRRGSMMRLHKLFMKVEVSLLWNIEHRDSEYPPGLYAAVVKVTIPLVQRSFYVFFFIFFSLVRLTFPPPGEMCGSEILSFISRERTKCVPRFRPKSSSFLWLPSFALCARRERSEQTSFSFNC